jgi:hypothetical protein
VEARNNGWTEERWDGRRNERRRDDRTEEIKWKNKGRNNREWKE